MFALNLSRRARLAGGIALAVALLTGCGGGGGSNDTTTNPPVVVTNTAPVSTMLLSGMVGPGVDGADATAGLTSELILSGSSSSDANGDALTYKWSIVSKPATSALALAADTSVKQVLRADVAGTYVLNLRVTDSKGAYSDKKVTILIQDNLAPVTNVVITATYTGVTSMAPTQSLHVGSAVVLDAKGSKDADGDLVTTTWTLLEKPAGSTARLTIDGAVSRFIADSAGLYKVRAHGIDPKGAYSETVYTFSADNQAPTTVVVASAIAPAAAAGHTITVPSGYVVSLENNTYDFGASTYASATWKMISKPAGSSASLSASTGQLSQLTTDYLGDYVVELTATDKAGAISSVRTIISVKNYGPWAHMSSNVAPIATQSSTSIRLPLNSPVTLRGGASTDPDGDVLTYTWMMSGKPSGSTAAVSSTSGDTTQITADMAGTYTITLRVTDSKGAFSETSKTFTAGSYAPVAVVDKSFATVLLGNPAVATAAMSFDEDSGALSYSWAIDAAPAGSTAAIAAPSAAALSFTPDLAGDYLVSVTVSDGVNKSVAVLPVRALASMVANVELNFAPDQTRYSKGLDQLVILSTNPNALKMVDPFSGAVKTVILPTQGRALNLSPDGRLAVVLHENIVSLVDLNAGTLIRSSTTAFNFSEAFVTDSGIAQLLGRMNYNGSSTMAVIDARTGTDLTATLGMSGGGMYDEVLGVYSAKMNRAYLSNSSYITSLAIDSTTGKVSSAMGHYSYDAIGSLYLSENEDILFTSSGAMHRTDTLANAGKLSFTGTMQSLSHSAQTNETLVMPVVAGAWPDYLPTYSSALKRYVGALFVADTDLTLPIISGQQSYGISIHHSANGRQVALVQTVTNVRNGAGVRYFVVVR